MKEETMQRGEKESAEGTLQEQRTDRRIRIKLCGLTRERDIAAANELKVDYIGFVFAKKSRRYLSPEVAAGYKKLLDPAIAAVGVFVREDPAVVASLLNEGVIDLAQLHGGEDEAYVRRLRTLTDRPLIQAFRVDSMADIEAARRTLADFPLLDSGTGGTGTSFDWNLAKALDRPYFLAGGLRVDNVAEAAAVCTPYAVDVSSGIETDGTKDEEKMKAFVRAVGMAQTGRAERTDS